MQFLRPFLFVLFVIISLLFNKHNMKGISIVQKKRQIKLASKQKTTRAIKRFNIYRHYPLHVNSVADTRSFSPYTLFGGR